MLEVGITFSSAAAWHGPSSRSCDTAKFAEFIDLDGCYGSERNRGVIAGMTPFALADQCILSDHIHKIASSRRR